MSQETLVKQKYKGIRPREDRIVLEPIELEQVTSGGVYLTEQYRDSNSFRARVVAFGPGRMLQDGTRHVTDLKKGDEVLYGKYSVTTIHVNDKEYLLARDADIMAVFEPIEEVKNNE